jgi:hypothetical protein
MSEIAGFAVVMIWDITPHSPLKVNRRNLSPKSSGSKRELRLFFEPKVGDMFLRNVG